MNSLADTPQGIETLKELIALQDIMPAEQFTYGFTENYAQYYAQGRGFCEFGWPSLWRYSNDAAGSQSVIAGKGEDGEPSQTAVSKVPGTMHGDDLIRSCIHAFAWDFVVSNYSPIQEAAYCFSQWITGPTMSMRSIPNEGGYFDPWRDNHFFARRPKSSLLSGDSGHGMPRRSWTRCRRSSCAARPSTSTRSTST